MPKGETNVGTKDERELEEQRSELLIYPASHQSGEQGELARPCTRKCRPAKPLSPSKFDEVWETMEAPHAWTKDGCSTLEFTNIYTLETVDSGEEAVEETSVGALLPSWLLADTPPGSPPPHDTPRPFVQDAGNASARGRGRPRGEPIRSARRESLVARRTCAHR